MPKIMISKSMVFANPQPIVKIALDELAVEKELQQGQQGQNVKAIEKSQYPNDLEGNSKQHEMIDKQKVLQVLNSGQLDSFQVKQDKNGTTVTFTVKKPGVLRGQEQQEQGGGSPEQQPMQAAAAKNNKDVKKSSYSPEFLNSMGLKTASVIEA
jgi:hypothetical protein